MSEEKKIEAPVSGWVKGGTTSLAWDNEQARLKAEAEQRRRQEDERQRIARENPAEAHINELKLGGRNSHASIVLELKHARDNEVINYVVCELIVEDDGNLVLNMACPKCADRGIGDNFKISQKNRRFELDTRRQGELWVNPRPPHDTATLAGAITLMEWVKCPNLGCVWKFIIDDNVLRME
jgi:hypothetical protein